MLTSRRLLVLALLVLVLSLQTVLGFAQVDCSETYVFQGATAEDRFGKSVSGAGDVDNDGYADVIIGAWGSDVGGPDAGQAYVYSGQLGGLVHTLTGNAGNDYFGWSVSNFMDVNGDGFDDVVVGARNASGVGEAYVFSGFDGSVLHTFTGAAAGDNLGWSVAPAGDVNMDGRVDLIIGTPSSDGGGTGHAYVYSGLDYSELHAFDGEAVGDAFGHAAAGAGDVNNDGFDDVIVGAPQNDAGGLDAGRAYVYSGQNGSLLLTLTGDAAQYFFGYSVAGAGDLNSDTHADLIVGATGAAATGKAYAISGDDGSLLYDLTGEAADDQFGWSVAATGDVSGDGIPEVVVGAKFNDVGANNAGRVYIHSGANGALIHIFTGQGIRRNLGTAVASAGDVNNDGIDDIIAGGPRRGAGLARVYTCLPPPTIPTLSDLGAIVFGALLLILVVVYVRRTRVQHA